MDDAEKITQFSYKNAEVFKLDNRRIHVMSVPEEGGGGYQIEFKSLSSDHEPRATHKVLKGKIVCTEILLTDEAALALCRCLTNQLLKDDKF